MSALIIWMNTHEAKLFHLESTTINMEKIQFHGPKHPDETVGKNHQKNQSDETVFFRQLLDKLRGAESKKWLIMGPGMGPVHFEKFLKEHAVELSDKVIGVEKVDRMPDSEILSVGRQFLQKYYLFHSA